MRGFVIGLVLGGTIVGGVGSAIGGEDWGLAPMHARVGSHLYRKGYCKDWRHTTPVAMWSAESALYVCKAKFKPPEPP